MKKSLVSTILLFLIVAVGLFVRVINLGEPGFGTDEPLHVYAAKGILETGEPRYPSGIIYDRGLLFTQAVAFSFKLLGINEFAARFPSVFFGVLSIILVFFIGRKFFGTMVGLISATFVAFTPFEIAWSRECRMYAMVQFFFLLGFFAFYNGFENLRGGAQKLSNLSSLKHFWKNTAFFSNWGLNWKWIILSVISLYISFSLHSLTAIYGASILFYLFLMSLLVLRNKGFRELVKSKYLILFSMLTVAGIVCLYAIPGMFEFIKNHLFFAPAWARGNTFNPLYYSLFLSSTATFPIGVLLILGSIQVVTHEHKEGFYTLVCVMVPLIILTFIPTYVSASRYIFNIFPLIILIATYSIGTFIKTESKMLSELLQRYDMSKHRLFIGGCLLILVFLYISSFWIYHGYHITVDYYDEKSLGMTHRNWKEACNYVRNNSSPEDIIITTEPLTASYYQCGNVNYYIRNYPEPQPMMNNVKGILDLASLQDVISRNPRGWIIIDAGRFKDPIYMSRDVREFIDQNLSHYTTEPDKTMLVYNWHETRISGVLADDQ
jgi:4-amino-4-deoxy-L-arabinose transferase-like glycosyltransferase